MSSARDFHLPDSDRSAPSGDCVFRDEALSFVLDELGEEARTAFRDHLLEGCGTCGRELEQARHDVASLDLAIALRSRRRPDESTFDQTRAELGVRLKARVEAAERSRSKRRREDEADGPASDPPVPCPPLESSSAPGIEVAPFETNQWVETPFPGIRMRVLSVDRPARRWTCLIQMAPGASYPSHRHAGDEECLVLSGELDIGGRVLTTGDYQIACESSIHPPHTTRTGCEILVTASWENEVLS